MTVGKYLAFFGAIALVACERTDAEPKFRSFDLNLVHPSQNSTYIGVSPGTPKADLPRLRHLKTGDFSEYLREKTGCVVDRTRETHVIGRKRTPAGYMVPIVCL